MTSYGTTDQATPRRRRFRARDVILALIVGLLLLLLGYCTRAVAGPNPPATTVTVTATPTSSVETPTVTATGSPGTTETKTVTVTETVTVNRKTTKTVTRTVHARTPSGPPHAGGGSTSAPFSPFPLVTGVVLIVLALGLAGVILQRRRQAAPEGTTPKRRA